MRGTLVRRNDKILSLLHSETATPVQGALEAAGADLRTGAAVFGAAHGHALLSAGTRVRADLVIHAAGVHPEAGLARAAGLLLGPALALLVTMAGQANRHGRPAADDIAGDATTDAAGVLATAIRGLFGLFGLRIGPLGPDEKTLIAARRAHRVIHTHPASQAGYYPGARQMAIERLDVIAVAMSANITASAPSRLELAHAPQYGPRRTPSTSL